MPAEKSCTRVGTKLEMCVQTLTSYAVSGDYFTSNLVDTKQGLLRSRKPTPYKRVKSVGRPSLPTSYYGFMLLFCKSPTGYLLSLFGLWGIKACKVALSTRSYYRAITLLFTGQIGGRKSHPNGTKSLLCHKVILLHAASC